MKKPIFYLPYADARYLAFIAIVAIVASVLFLNLATAAFTRVGFSSLQAILLLTISLLGGVINLPLFRIRTIVPIRREGLVSYGLFVYRMPIWLTEEYETLIAINVGGAVIPLILSVFLLVRFTQAVPVSAATVLIVTIVVYRLAKPVENLGIVILGFWPPLITVAAVLGLSTVFHSPHEVRFIAAYVGGTIGTLLGADVLNLRSIYRLGTGIASIGGAGTFDGIFLAGVVAVLLV
jgi:uncharacterized membrane protein